MYGPPSSCIAATIDTLGSWLTLSLPTAAGRGATEPRGADSYRTPSAKSTDIGDGEIAPFVSDTTKERCQPRELSVLVDWGGDMEAEHDD